MVLSEAEWEGPLHVVLRPTVLSRFAMGSHFRADDDDPCHERGVRFLCNECCAEIHDGFIRDLKEMKQIRELRRLGFHRARPTTDGEVFVLPEGRTQ
jgi:hypothetical protein